MTCSKCGKKFFNDELRQERFTVAELQDLTFPLDPVMYLAFVFFLNKHAVSRACVVMIEVPSGGRKEERR